MRTLLATIVLTAATAANAADKEAKVTGPLDHKMTGIDGKDADLAKYKGKVVLFVNVASKCGYTPQYKGMQALYEKYEKDGLVVIGVPANDFGKQEPGSNDDIKTFCTTNYKVTFPLLGKVTVKGDGKVELYKSLIEGAKAVDAKQGGEVAWNFEKFLVGRDGKVAGRFKSGVDPDGEEMTKAIAAELAKK